MNQDYKHKQFDNFTGSSIDTKPTQDSLITTKLSKAEYDVLPPEIKMNYMYNHDTGEVIDLQSQEVVNLESIQLKFNKDAVWQDFWNSSQAKSIELLTACKQGKLDKVKELLESSFIVDINARDENDWTPLHFSCSLGLYQLSDYLISKGSEIEAQDIDGRTPLFISVLQHYYSVSELMLRHKANVDSQDVYLNTPLHVATIENYVDLIDLLLRLKANPNIQNDDFQTCLQMISSTDALKIYEQYGYHKQKLTISSERTKSTNDLSNILSQNTVDKVMKFLGKTISTNQIPKQVQFPLRMSTIKVGGQLGPDSFIIHKEIGKGSFGVVYLVTKKDLPNKLFAMKVLKKDKISPKLLPYIQTEKGILSVVDHPFIVKLHYSFQNKSKLFLVMDFCSGGDMTKLLDLKNKFPEEIAKVYIAEIVLALEGLHKQKIMYRDLKPQNVIIDSNGHAMLTDFGLAKTDIDHSTDTKSFCGTPAYMPPEVVHKKRYNRQVDWYQLGAVTHEMLFGIPPFYSNNREELFENIKKQKLKFPSTSKISKEGQLFMQQLLERDPSKRLGAQTDAEEIRGHAWFNNINWLDCYNKKIAVPAPSFVNQPTNVMIVDFDEDYQELRQPIDNWTFAHNI